MDRSMRVLEARFHPATRSGPRFVVVGRVVCDHDRVSIEQAKIAPAAVRPFNADHLYEKLAFLVTSAVGDRARALLALQSGFWSFVEAPAR